MEHSAGIPDADSCPSYDVGARNMSSVAAESSSASEFPLRNLVSHRDVV